MHCLLSLLVLIAAATATAAQVVMFWTTPWQDRYLPRHDAVLSSYCRHGYNVTVYAVVTKGDARFEEVRRKHRKVSFVEMNEEFFDSLQDCPQSEWLGHIQHRKGPFYYSHLTDYLRFCLLYKHGGIYSDFDALLLRRLPVATHSQLLVGKDEIGESEGGCGWCLGGGRHYAAPGVMIAGGAGLPVLATALKIGFGDDYEPNTFGWCGPQALTRAVKQSRRHSVLLLPTHVLYPVNWSNAWRLFDGNPGTLWTKIVNNKDTASIHFYGSATRSRFVERGSIMEKFIDQSVLILKHYWEYGKESLTECIQIQRADRITLAVEHGTLNFNNITIQQRDSVNLFHEKLQNVRYTPGAESIDKLTITLFENDEILQTITLALFGLEKSVTIVTKTFGRMSKALALLDSLYDIYPKHRFNVLVGDDGKPALGSSKTYQSPMFEYVPFEYDIGLSEGRNRLLDMVRTDYAVFLDDDFVMTRESDIGSLLASSILDSVDIVGGKSPNDVSEHHFDYCGLMEQHEHNRTLSLIRAHYDNNTITGCQFVDFVPNLFLAKTASLKRVRWDPLLKLGEHEDFFWRAKQMGLRVATSPSVSFLHMQSRFWENKTEYDRMRLRVFDFLKLALQKNNWQTLITMGRTVMHLMEISDNPIQKISVESVSPYELRLIIVGDRPYKRYRLQCESLDSTLSKTDVIYDTTTYTIRDLAADQEYTVSVFAGNYTGWSSSPATIRVKTPSLHDNLLVDGHFDSKWTCWKATIGTAFNFEPTVPWKQTGLLTGRSIGYALGMSVIHSELLPAYTRQHQFHHSVYQTVQNENDRMTCPKGGKLVFAGWSRPDRFSHTEIPGAIRGYRLQLEVELMDHRHIEAVSVDFEHQSNEWQSGVASVSLERGDVVKAVTVRAVLDAMRAGAFFDDFYLGLWCK